MRSICTLVCGIVVIASLFMSWFSMKGCGAYTIKYSGWEAIGGELDWVSTGGPIITLAGGSLMIVCALAPFLLAKAAPAAWGIFGILGIAARTVAALAIFGAIWYMIDTREVIEGWAIFPVSVIGTGTWIAIVAAAGGIICGVTTPTPASHSRNRELFTRQATGFAAAPKKETVHHARLTSRSDAARNHLQRAFDYETWGKDDEAIAAYSQAIECNPNHALAYYNRGSLLMLRGLSSDAVRDLEKAAELSDDPRLIEMAQERLRQLNT